MSEKMSKERKDVLSYLERERLLALHGQIGVHEETEEWFVLYGLESAYRHTFLYFCLEWKVPETSILAIKKEVAHSLQNVFKNELEQKGGKENE